MARLSDIPKVYRSVGIKAFAMRVWDEVAKDSLFAWASALAYSWLLSIFPFFIFLLALVPHLPYGVRERAKIEIQHEVVYRFPSVADNMLWKEVADNPENILNKKLIHTPLLCIGLGLALWAASGGTAMTMSALDRCYELDCGRSVVRHRIVAILLTMMTAVMLLAVLCLLPIASLAKAWVLSRGYSPGRFWLLVFDVARWTLSVSLIFMVLTVIYYNGPAIRHRFCILTPGAVFVAIVWVALGLILKVYVERVGALGYMQTYGAVGGVAILLLFFYLDALVLLIGAEINAEVDFEVLRVRRGSRDFRNPEDFSDGAPMSC